MNWTETECGEYMAGVLIDSNVRPLVGDPIRGFDPYNTVTPAIKEAFQARIDDLERKRRDYLKARRRRDRASRRGLNAIDFNL